MLRNNTNNKIKNKFDSNKESKGGLPSKGNGIDCRYKSAIEYFLSTGRLPPAHSNLSSKGKGRNDDNDKSKMSNDYAEFDKIIEGTDIRMKEKIYKIKNIKEDIGKANFDKFESLAKINKWEDEQMGLIFSSLIENDEIKLCISKSSYKAMKGQLLDLKYPRNDLEIYKQNLEELKQSSFYYIEEYEQKIQELMFGYCHIRGLTRKKSRRYGI